MATKQKIDPLTLFLMGKGQFQSLQRSGAAREKPWRGMSAPANPPFDAQQALENRRVYPELFRE